MTNSAFARLILVIVIALGEITSALAQSPKKLNNLFVYGNGFSFVVTEPDGWHGDTEKVAEHYHVKVVFSRLGSPAKDDVTIRVRVNKKQDENTIEDLNYDMQGYKEEFPIAQFMELHIAHPEYKTFARTVFMPKQFYEYVAYINPGVGAPNVISVAMSTKETPATEQELKAYQAILASIRWLPASIPAKR